MFKIYHSNHLDTLEKLMESIVKHERLNDPFEPEIVLVQSMDMAKWLQISLSKKLDIVANIEFLLPANFIWKMFEQVLSDIPSKSTFSKQKLIWKLMILLPEMLKQEEFIRLQHYLSNDINNRKLLHLASCIADLYDQYLVYRPIWLTSWESGELFEGLPKEEQVWQALLWKALLELTERLEHSKWHCANLYDRFVTTLESTTEPPSGLPSRIFVYGIYSLPPIYFDLLKSLSKYVDIHILFKNPCRYYWGDIQDDRYPEKLATYRYQLLSEERPVLLFKNGENITQSFDKEGIQTLPNPLLASWGTLGCDYIHMLSKVSSSRKGKDVNVFSEIIPDSLLHNIQLDILNLENRAVIGSFATEFTRSNMKKRCLDPNDRSFTVHVCHSRQREVEILHDQLLAMLQDDPSLAPRDIVVMVTDIDSYVPFIQAVFGSAAEDLYIPYSISDRKARQFYPIIQAFISLLSLLDSRFVSKDVLALLDVSILASRFGIDEEGLRYLRRWINESGVRWGLDDDSMKELNLPKTGQHTWKFGLTRMLLGYAMESSEGEWKEVLPYDESSGLIANLIDHLTSLLMQLTFWHNELKQARTLDMWLPLCKRLLNDFFLLNSETEAATVLIEQHWQNIINEGIESHYDEAISFSLLRDELIHRLDQEHIGQRFLSGSVNICALMPMRSIPFMVICLLGMNDGVYPRMQVPLSFDLMSCHPKRGDRSRRDDDRYLFLEVLTSAQKVLYISYIGYSIQDNSKRFPSVLVQELVDYIGKSHYLLGDEGYNCDESDQRVKTHIIFHHSRMPFDPINYEHNEQQSYVREWLPAARKEGTEQIDFIQILKPNPIKILKFEKLQNFWTHTVRAFFQQRLQVHFYSESEISDNEIFDEEPFSLEGLVCYQINKQLLNTLVEQKNVEMLFRRYRTAGLLPYGNFGEFIWNEQCQEMQSLAKRIIKHLQPSQNMEINLKCNGVQLIGWLRHVQNNGLLRWRPSILNVSQGLHLWLEHLVYNASGNKGKSQLFVRKNGEWCFPPMSTETAQNYLNLFVEGYLQGMNKPLLLFPESGGAWIKTCYDAENDILLTDEASLQKARRSFFRAYEGNAIMRGEGKDIWYQRLWRTLEPKYFDIITQEAKQYLLPLFKYNRS